MQAQRRVNDDHLAHPFGVMRGDVDGKIRPEGVPAQHHAFEVQRIEERQHVARVVRHPVSGRRPVALAAAAKIGRHDPELGVEPRGDQSPELVGVGGEAVQQDQRRVVTGEVEQVEADAVGE